MDPRTQNPLLKPNKLQSGKTTYQSTMRARTHKKEKRRRKSLKNPTMQHQQENFPTTASRLVISKMRNETIFLCKAIDIYTLRSHNSESIYFI